MISESDAFLEVALGGTELTPDAPSSEKQCVWSSTSSAESLHGATVLCERLPFSSLGPSSFICSQCLKIFQTKNDLEKHLKWHSGEERDKCIGERPKGIKESGASNNRDQSLDVVCDAESIEGDPQVTNVPITCGPIEITPTVKQLQSEQSEVVSIEVCGAEVRMKRKYAKRKNRVSMPRKKRKVSVKQDVSNSETGGIQCLLDNSVQINSLPCSSVRESGNPDKRSVILHTECPENLQRGKKSLTNDFEFDDKRFYEDTESKFFHATARETSTVDKERSDCQQQSYEGTGDKKLVAVAESNPDPSPVAPILEKSLSQVPLPPIGDQHHQKSEPETLEPGALIRLERNITLLISKDWVISIAGKAIRLILLSPFENVSVERSVVWESNVFKIFVHNQELPSKSFIWNATKFIKPNTIDEVSDCLAKLAHLVQYAFICRGVRHYRKLWCAAIDNGGVQIENSFYEGYECLRDSSCSLLMIEPVCCQACCRKAAWLRNLNRRLRQKQGLKILSFPFFILTKEKIYKNEKNKLQKMNWKLRKAIKQFIVKQTVFVSCEFSSDLARIFHDNQHIMSNVQKLFWSEQLMALSEQKSPCVIQWNPLVIKLALHIHMKSRSSYTYLKNFLVLPSERTLYDFSHFEAQEGPWIAIMKEIRERLKRECQDGHQKFFNLLFDEMQICSDIVINCRTREVIGYTHLPKVEEEMATFKLGMSPQSAYQAEPVKNILVYFAQGVTNNLQEAVGAYGNATSSAGQLYTRTWEMIHGMESYGLKVLSLICDGTAINKKFFKMNTPLNAKLDFAYGTTISSSEEERPIFFIVNPSQTLIALRNSLKNSFSHKQSKQLWKDGEELSWKVLETLYSVTSRDKWPIPTLTKGHIKLTSYSCRKEILATQIMSINVTLALDRLKKDPRFKGLQTKQLKMFIKAVHAWFSCINGSVGFEAHRHELNERQHPYVKGDKRFKFLLNDILGFFNDWQESIKARNGNLSTRAQRKMFISRHSFESLLITTFGFTHSVKYMLEEQDSPIIDARKFSLDAIEQYCCLLRILFDSK